MHIASLQAFVSVAECGSFSRASEQLYLTQPAISKRIAALESELGAPLFDRIGRNVTLTESGQALLPRAQRILLELEDSRCAIANLSGRVEGQLRIGTSHHIGLHRLPPVLRRYSADYPNVELDLRFMDSEQACNAIAHGDLELGIITLPLETPADLKTELIWNDALVVVCGHSHLLSRKPSLSLKTLLEHKAILPERGTYTRELIEQAVAASARKISVHMVTNYLETIKMLVSVGLGWSVLPRTMLSKDLKVLPVPKLKLQRRLGLVWHGQRTLSNAAHAMMVMLKNNANEKIQ